MSIWSCHQGCLQCAVFDHTLLRNIVFWGFLLHLFSWHQASCTIDSGSQTTQRGFLLFIFSTTTMQCESFLKERLPAFFLLHNTLECFWVVSNPIENSVKIFKRVYLSLQSLTVEVHSAILFLNLNFRNFKLLI